MDLTIELHTTGAVAALATVGWSCLWWGVIGACLSLAVWADRADWRGGTTETTNGGGAE